MKKVQTPLFQGITENEWNEMQKLQLHASAVF